MIGAISPASVTIPKNRIANMNMPATGAIFVMPETMKPASSVP